MCRGLYDWMYRYNRVPWDIGPRKEMVEVVGNGRIQPGRAIDASAMLSTGLGCGTDYSPAAITLCQERGAAAGLAVE